MRVAGVVLAAGAGRRLGRPKAEVVLAGERLVDRAVRVLREGGCADLLVVSGAVPLTVPGAAVAHNPDWATGMASSLRVGLAALPPEPEAACVALVDQPGVGAAVVARLLAATRAGARMAVAAYGGELRNPVVLARELWPAAADAATGDRGARALVAARPDLVTAVECGDVGDPADVDTPEQLAALLGP